MRLGASDPVPSRPELKSFCEKMDGLGLRKYIIERPKERTAIRVEVADAFKDAPNPALMVLDALDGFCGLGSDSELIALRRAYVVLLEELMQARVEIAAEAKERARTVATVWKGKMTVVSGVNDGDEENREKESLEKLGYLLLLATYWMVSDGGYDVNELVDYAVVVAKYGQAVDLFRVLGFGDRISGKLLVCVDLISLR
ncbi:Inactive FRIGIDA-like protein 2 [Abeliophyllum distichum]|uniref:FRIGIDA-like protein n=1 Tax=Abeliophyllum distichum TaxID=126358 RepID=A0ABD1UFF2_9LAMI